MNTYAKDPRWFKPEDMVPCKWHDYPDANDRLTGHVGWSNPCPSCTAFERGQEAERRKTAKS